MADAPATDRAPPRAESPAESRARPSSGPRVPDPPVRGAPADPAALRRAAARTLAVGQAGLGALARALEGPLGEAFLGAVEALHSARGRAVVTGMGKSGHVARKVAATLASTGTPALFLHPAEASHGDLGMVMAGDAVLALSWSGETAELRDVIHHTRRHRVPLIALTAGTGSALARSADLTLLLPRVEEACPHGLAPTTSTLIQLALGDALAVALLERRGFTAANFRGFHPGGKLGARLLTAGELMRRAPDLPLVGEDSAMAEAVIAMTGAGLGCAVATDAAGQLSGIVTDGDLRRHMAPDLLARPVASVMTRDPRAIGPALLASAALAEMNARQILVLVVVEAGRPVGVLHMHALLAAGVA